MYTSPPTEYRQFSAEVRIELNAAGQTFRVASVGPEEVILHADQDADVAPMDAEITLFVDGDEFVWPVYLPHGVVPFSRVARIEPLTEMRCVSRRSPTL